MAKSVSKPRRTTAKAFANMVAHTLAGEIRIRSNLRYTFYLMGQKAGAAGGPVRVAGAVREVGQDFVRVRKSTGYRTHTDIVIPFNAILYVEETTLSTGGE